MTSETTFPLFTSFPPEIQSLILEQCPPADQICLRLTSSTLYTLPITSPAKPSLSYAEDPFCLVNLWDPNLKGIDYTNLYYHVNGIGQESCHIRSLRAVKGDKHVDQLIENTPRGTVTITEKCRTTRTWCRQYQHHCRCFSSELWPRLQSFIKNSIPGGIKSGQDLRYCRNCEKFTWRKKAWGMKCYHGKPKPRRKYNNRWTNKKSRGGFGYMWWKTGFNTRAMEAMEGRLERGVQERGGPQRGWRRRGSFVEQGSEKRYELRELKGKAREERGLFEGWGGRGGHAVDW